MVASQCSGANGGADGGQLNKGEIECLYPCTRTPNGKYLTLPLYNK